MTPQVQAWTVIRRQGAAEALAVPAPALVLPDITAGVYAPPRHDEVAGRSGAAEAGHRGARPGRVLACADLVSAGLAITLMSLVAWAPPAAAVFASLPLLLIATHAAGLYGHDELRLKRSTLDETPALLQLSGLFTLSVAILHPIPFGRAGLGVELATLWAAMFVAVLLTRLAARALIARAAPVERCLMVSEPARAQRLRDRFASATHGRSAVVATLRSAGFAGISDAQDVRDLVAELEVDRILVAPTTEDPAEIDGIVRMCRAAGVPLNLLPAVFEAVGPVAEIEDVDGLMLVGVPPFGLARGALGVKRTMDVVFVFAGCLLLAPLMLAIAAAVRLDSRGPVFFRQTRVGRDGRRFRIWKFRSMVEGADEQKLGLLSLNEVGEGMFKLADDPRVTRVGRLLRRTSLDELPQLLNVLRGEMSLVGPRPLVVDEDDRVCGLDRSRLSLLPGMTGPWQIGARAPMKDMLRIDYLYVASWSPWLDVKLLLRTLRHVLRRGNA